MIRLLAILCALALLLPLPSFSQGLSPGIAPFGGMTPSASNAVLPDARTNLGFGPTCSVIKPPSGAAADPTGVADSSAAFNACAAVTGPSGVAANVYAPAGTYYLAKQVNLSNGQCLYGDGRENTTITVDQGFDPAASGVIVLAGREQNGPCIHDLDIQFAQPSDQGTRANFANLGSCTSGLGGTGCKYPPAISLGTSNRFVLYNLRIARAWDGIINPGGNSTGGYFIENIEMSALDKGLLLDQTFDFGHLSHFHFWNFDISSSSALYTGVYQDGNTFAAQFGSTGTVGGNSGEVDDLSITDFTIWQSRVSVQNANSWLHGSNIALDGNNSTLEITNNNWLQFSNVYATGASTGANTHSQIDVQGGHNIITNLRANSNKAIVKISNGYLNVVGGRMEAGSTINSSITETGGTLSAMGISFTAAGGAWTVPLVNNTGGQITFIGNTFNATPGDVGGLSTIDGVNNTVLGNDFQGWGFSIPGLQGNYGLNGSGAAPQVLFNSSIPFIMPSSGTMGNNGALSGITALPTTYASAYVYMPAAAIAAGSAAGWYYAVFSGTTAATLYNNTYSSGAPSIPSSPTAFSTTGPGLYTQTTGAPINAQTHSIAGNLLGKSHCLDTDFKGAFPNTAGNKTFKGTYGGSVIYSYGFGTGNSSLKASSTRMCNRGVTNVQIADFNTASPTSTTAFDYPAVDSTADQNLVYQLQLAVATDYAVIESAQIRFVP